mmetsp:Transcript_2321/g.8384  ORF Transcript_2321/g.8384 Transcript_2321/m.8384 type:complete len:206 (+) Transcript_2321:1597-2214(+)
MAARCLRHLKLSASSETAIMRMPRGCRWSSTRACRAGQAREASPSIGQPIVTPWWRQRRRGLSGTSRGATAKTPAPFTGIWSTRNSWTRGTSALHVTPGRPTGLPRRSSAWSAVAAAARSAGAASRPKVSSLFFFLCRLAADSFFPSVHAAALSGHAGAAISLQGEAAVGKVSTFGFQTPSPADLSLSLPLPLFVFAANSRVLAQ